MSSTCIMGNAGKSACAKLITIMHTNEYHHTHTHVHARKREHMHARKREEVSMQAPTFANEASEQSSRPTANFGQPLVEHGAHLQEAARGRCGNERIPSYERARGAVNHEQLRVRVAAWSQTCGPHRACTLRHCALQCARILTRKERVVGRGGGRICVQTSAMVDVVSAPGQRKTGHAPSQQFARAPGFFHFQPHPITHRITMKPLPPHPREQQQHTSCELVQPECKK